MKAQKAQSKQQQLEKKKKVRRVKAEISIVERRLVAIYILEKSSITMAALKLPETKLAWLATKHQPKGRS